MDYAQIARSTCEQAQRILATQVPITGIQDAEQLSTVLHAHSRWLIDMENTVSGMQQSIAPIPDHEENQAQELTRLVLSMIALLESLHRKENITRLAVLLRLQYSTPLSTQEGLQAIRDCDARLEREMAIMQRIQIKPLRP